MKRLSQPRMVQLVLRPETYIDVVNTAVDAITVAAADNLDAPVEHCPDFDVGRLLEHTGAFCRILEGRLARDEEWKPASGNWQEASAEVAGDPLGWHRTWGAALIRALRAAAPAERITTWAGPRTRHFWFRRAAHELTIHRWDAEHAHASTSPIDDLTALDGIDEFLGEFGGRAAPRYEGDGETYLFVADNVGSSSAVTVHPDRFELNSRRDPDVEARAPAETIYRFLWGRATPDDLVANGDTGLLNRWHERIRL